MRADYLLSTLIALFGAITLLPPGLSYGPSIYALTKDEILETNNDTDSGWSASNGYKKTRGQTVNLSDYSPTFSVLLPLVEGKPFVNQSEALSYFKYLHHGEFYVAAPEGWGIIAVVQTLRLATVFGVKGKCLDYIEFSDQSPGKEKELKICGTVHPDDLHPTPSMLVGKRSFISETGGMTVEIFIFSSTIHSEWTIKESHSEKIISVELSFTAFPLKPDEELDPLGTTSPSSSLELADNATEILDTSPCSRFYQLTELLELNETTSPFKPCNEDAAPYPFCIHEHLFCDGVIHCGFSPENFADDEKPPHCSHNSPIKYHTEQGDLVVVANRTRVVPSTNTARPHPLEIRIMHWIVIGLGSLIFILFAAGLAWTFRRWFYSGNVPAVEDSELQGAPPSRAAATSSSDRTRQHVLIERILNLHKKATGNHIETV